jgi:hypothetical protein
MATTYEPIATSTVSGTVTLTVTFSSIPATYTDIVVVVAGNTNNLTAVMRFNNDSTAVYSRTVLRADGTTASSFRQNSQTGITIDGSVSQPFQNSIINVMNYSNTTTYKNALVRSNNAGAGIDQGIGVWLNTAAINRIDIASTGATAWLAGTTFTLYGIKAA